MVWLAGCFSNQGHTGGQRQRSVVFIYMVGSFARRQLLVLSRLTVARLALAAGARICLRPWPLPHLYSISLCALCVLSFIIIILLEIAWYGRRTSAPPARNSAKRVVVQYVHRSSAVGCPRWTNVYFGG